AGEMDAAALSLESLQPPPVINDTAGVGQLAAAVAAVTSCQEHLVALAEPVDHLAQAFVVNEPVGLGLTERLVRLARLAGSPAAPEPAWLNPVVKKALDEAREVLVSLLNTYRSRRAALQDVFTD